MKNPIRCQGCQKVLRADQLKPMSVHACPSCGNSIQIPYPGMAAGKFITIYFASWFAVLVAIAIIGQAGGLLIPLWFIFKLRLGYLRAINVGWRPLCSLMVLLPFIGAIFMACYSTGEGMKRVKAG